MSRMGLTNWHSACESDSCHRAGSLPSLWSGEIETKKLHIMKAITKAIGVVALGYILPLSAQTTETEKKTDVTKNADGSTTRTETTTTTFNTEARTKVVKYFETYKTNPHGLPPQWATKVKFKEIPAGWRTRIAPGVMIEEKERPYLVEAPADLVSVLPPASGGVRYYVAGSNVIAVDSSYKIVDSVQIPSVKIEVDD